MSEKTLFERIIDREIPATIVYEDDLCIAFNDINPQAPIHVLLVPKQCIDRLSNANLQHQTLLGHLMLTAGEVAKQMNIFDNFRLIINNGTDAGQTIFHLHLHILGGKTLNWPEP